VGLFASAKAGLRYINSGAINGYGGSINPGPYGIGTRPYGDVDYRTEAGPLWENSIVYLCLNMALNLFVDAPLIAQKRAGTKWEQLENHPAVDLFDAVGQDSDGTLFWYDALSSIYLAGNSYHLIVPRNDGLPGRLEWMPHWLCEPCWDPGDDKTFIAGYRYRANGVETIYRPEDVIHLRHGIRDPYNIRKSLSPMGSLLVATATDRGADIFCEAMMRNQGRPGVVLSPKGEVEVTPIQREGIVEKWVEKFGRSNSGRPLVSDIPIQIDIPSFPPEQMVLDLVRSVPEHRIPAAFGLSAQVVGVNAGDESKTYANQGAAVEAAYDLGIVPLQKRLARQLTRQVMSRYETGPRRQVVFGFDWTQVHALQEDEDALHKRAREDMKVQLLKRSEARQMIGQDSGPEDDIYVTTAPKGDDPDSDADKDSKNAA
jgi:phage portal protein BeeE